MSGFAYTEKPGAVETPGTRRMTEAEYHRYINTCRSLIEHLESTIRIVDAAYDTFKDMGLWTCSYQFLEKLREDLGEAIQNAEDNYKTEKYMKP